jgi:drug/metabolite transporter (DMT)-like permease
MLLILLGFLGAVLVLGFDIGKNIPFDGVIATVISLVSITSATIWQKKISNNLPLETSNTYQAIGGCLFHILIIVFVTKFQINFSFTFIAAMSHQVLLVSFGAFTILMFLIRENSASKTTSFFFLIPSVSALMAWLFLNEKHDLTLTISNGNFKKTFVKKEVSSAQPVVFDIDNITPGTYTVLAVWGKHRANWSANFEDYGTNIRFMMR